MYRYEGALNDIESSVVVLCWPANQPMEAKQMHCFLSTGTELSIQMILDYYSERWAIETYFKQVKGTLGFQGIQDPSPCHRTLLATCAVWLLIY